MHSLYIQFWRFWCIIQTWKKCFCWAPCRVSAWSSPMASSDSSDSWIEMVYKYIYIYIYYVHTYIYIYIIINYILISYIMHIYIYIYIYIFYTLYHIMLVKRLAGIHWDPTQPSSPSSCFTKGSSLVEIYVRWCSWGETHGYNHGDHPHKLGYDYYKFIKL